jgi:hypothetical protein
MSIFFPADDSVLALVRKVMKDNHEDLVKARVDVGVTFAISSKENQPALKEHGQPSFGMTKIVPPKDRVRKNIDVELWLDGDEWGTDSDLTRYAKVDHLLQRVEIKKPKPKKKKKKNSAAQHGSEEENAQHEEQEFLVDAGGKAILKPRKPDLFVPGGFREVIERNGKHAPECLILDQARRLMDLAVKVFDDEEAENERERSAARAEADAAKLTETPAEAVTATEPVSEEKAVEDLIGKLGEEVTA